MTRCSPLSFQFSDDEEDTKRVVRSAREKRYELLHNIIKSIRNSKKIKDFNKMETSFQELTKAFDKARPVILKEEAGITPRFYVRILVEMEDLINETWEDREGRRNMSKNNSKSLGALRQKLRKYIREEFDEDMAKFRENPDADDDEDEAGGGDKEDHSEDESEDEANMRKSQSKSREGSTSEKTRLKKALGDDEESDDSYWDSDSEESTESSSDDEPGMSLREKFLKKAPGEEKKEKKEKKKDRAKKPRQKEEELSDIEEEEGWKTVDRGALEKPKMFDKDAEINHELVVKKLHEIMAARGKKRTNRKEQIELLSELYSISEEHNLGHAIYVKVQFAIIAAIFDYNPKISSAMKPEYWEKCMPAMEKLMEMLHEAAEYLTTGDNISEEAESFEEKPLKVRGCFLSCVERMDEEFIKVLKGCDAHSNEYVDRLKDEPK